MSADAVPDRRERLVRPLFIAFLVASAVDLVGLLADVPAAHVVAKPLLMPLLAGYAAARRGPRLLVAALLFGWGGDTFLLLDADAAFLVGMGSFAAGHVCYLWLFGRARGSLPAAIAYAVVLTAFVVLLWPDLPADLRIPVTGYSLLLTAMAFRAAPSAGTRPPAGRSSCSPTRSSPPASRTGRSCPPPTSGSCSPTSPRSSC